MGKSKNQKPKKTVMTRIDEQTHRKLSAHKALYGCKTLSQAIDKLMEKKNELADYRDWETGGGIVTGKQFWSNRAKSNYRGIQ